MTKYEHMNKSSMRGICLFLILFSSIVVIIFPVEAYADDSLITSSSTSVDSLDYDGDGILDYDDLCPDDPTNTCVTVEESNSNEPPDEQTGTGAVDVESHSFEETTIIEFTNDGKIDIKSFRIWLSGDNSFKSFKTERGWSGEKTPQGVIIFTSSEFVKPDESIKIGIKTDKANPGINWKAIDKNNKEIEIGITIPEEIPTTSTTIQPESTEGVLSESIFRIIPEKPNAGSTIRVTGTNFGPNQQFEFLVGSEMVGTFQTDGTGYFMTTMKIPEYQLNERTNLIVKDLVGNEKNISLRIGDTENRIPITDDVKLSLIGVPQTIIIGDMVEVSGTAKPNSGVTASVTDPNNNVILTRTAQSDAKGNWRLEEPIAVPSDAQLGKYTAKITDGRETITKSWMILTSKSIAVTPVKVKFNPGEALKFNGTAKPSAKIELSLIDPLGIEKISDVFTVDASGVVQFEYPTLAGVDVEGTWTLISIQGKNKEFTYAGLGQNPSIPTNIEFDKLNYKATETANITLTGKPSEVVSILIVDPTDKPKGNSFSISLDTNGKAVHSFSLSGYQSGVYTTIVSKGNSKSTAIFAVGLQTGAGEIKINTTKLEYKPFDPVLVLGEANKNVILTLTLIDPKGNKIKEIETFTDKNGRISQGGFRIPSAGEPGIWKITAKSGPNFKTIDLEVKAATSVGMQVSTSEGSVIPKSTGKSIDIRVINAKFTVNITITGPEGELVQELSFPASKEGDVKLPWLIPTDIVKGNYTVTAKDGYNSAQTTFLIK